MFRRNKRLRFVVGSAAEICCAAAYLTASEESTASGSSGNKPDGPFFLYFFVPDALRSVGHLKSACFQGLLSNSVALNDLKQAKNAPKPAKCPTLRSFDFAENSGILNAFKGKAMALRKR